MHFFWTISARCLCSCRDGQEVHFFFYRFRTVSLLVRRWPRSALFWTASALFLHACRDVVLLKSFSISQALLWLSINWKCATHGVTKCRHGCGWSMPKLSEKRTYTGLSTSFKLIPIYTLHIVAGLLLSHIKGEH